MADEQIEVVDDVAEPAAEPVDRREALSEALTALETEEPKGEKVRGPDGKFVSPNAAKPVLTAPEPEAPWRKPPNSWKKDHHETYGVLPPQIQEYVHQREMEMQKGVGEARTKAVFADQVNKVVEPYLDNIRRNGVDVPTAIQYLLSADHTLRNGDQNQKVQYMAQLCRQYGIDFQSVLGTAAPHATSENAALVALQNKLAQFEANMEAERKAKEDADNQSLLKQIEDFSHNKPHFAQVRSSMAGLLQSGLAKTLDEAYDKAIRLDPDLSQDSARQAAEARKQTKDQAAKAARSAAVSVKGSTPGITKATNAQDRRSVLAEAFDSIEGRL